MEFNIYDILKEVLDMDVTRPGMPVNDHDHAVKVPVKAPGKPVAVSKGPIRVKSPSKS